ncbi:MAG: hypothetical protein EXR21_04790 [Flavobacteriaceae bacterium]|nr:hypothetical protein [Flavobacteriaceae bacterium]
MFIIHRIIFTLNLLAVAALLGSYLSPYLSPVSFSAVSFLGLSYPVLLLANIVFIIYWAIFFKLKFVFSLGAIMLGYGHISKTVKVFSTKSRDRAGKVVIMSFNAHFFGFGDRGVDTGPFFNMVKEEQPDIVCFQELMSEDNKRKNYINKAKKATGFEHFYFDKAYTAMDTIHREYGMMTISRYPIVGHGSVKFLKNSVNRCLWTDVLVNDDTIRVFNVHLESIKIDEGEYNIMAMPGGKDSTLKMAENIFEKLKAAWTIRAPQAEQIQELIAASPHQVLVCGDFNDTPMSYAYSCLSTELDDAFVDSGSGLSQTYAGQLPSFRIDYILGSKNFRFSNYEVKSKENSRFSDHKCIIAWCQLHPEDGLN